MEFDRITLDPRLMSGKPCIRGMRISVSFVLKMLSSGMDRDRILREHPDLEPADIDQCLGYVAAITEEETYSLPLAIP